MTGGNKGIGKEIVRKLVLMPGMGTVVLGCRTEQLGEVAAAEIRATRGRFGGANVVVKRLDLTDAGSIAELQEYLTTSLGRLDVLVNNAAVCFNDPTLYGKVPHTPFAAQAGVTLDTNFFGTLAVTRAMLPLLRASTSPDSPGRIVNVASAAGRLRGSRDKTDTLTSDALTVPVPRT